MATRIIVKSKLFAAVIFLTAASFAAEVRFEDNGAAPSYRPYYPCLTVKDREKTSACPPSQPSICEAAYTEEEE